MGQWGNSSNDFMFNRRYLRLDCQICAVIVRNSSAELLRLIKLGSSMGTEFPIQIEWSMHAY